MGHGREDANSGEHTQKNGGKSNEHREKGEAPRLRIETHSCEELMRGLHLRRASIRSKPFRSIFQGTAFTEEGH